MRLPLTIAVLCAAAHAQEFNPKIPKVWDEAALKDWATPLAGLNMRPSHMTEKEYYAMPLMEHEAFLMYFPGHEPKGYWDKLRRTKPQVVRYYK